MAEITNQDVLDAIRGRYQGNPNLVEDASVAAKVESLQAEMQAVKAAIQGILQTSDASSHDKLDMLYARLEAIETKLNGTIDVQQTGSKVVEEVVVNAQSVAAGGHVEFSMAPTNEDEIWIMVSIDKQPWSITTSTQVYSGSNGTSDTLYPRRADVTNTFTGATPAASLFMGGIIYGSTHGYSPPSDVREAKARIVPYKSNAKGRILNKSTETATITVRLLRIWRKS